MSEQDAASVAGYLDRLEAQRGNEAEQAEDRRVRAAVQRWEYMTWTVVDTKTGRAIRLVNGERPADYPPEQSALAEAGEQGWEMVGVAGVGTKPEQVLYFKRLKAED